MQMNHKYNPYTIASHDKERQRKRTKERRLGMEERGGKIETEGNENWREGGRKDVMKEERLNG